MWKKSKIGRNKRLQAVAATICGIAMMFAVTMVPTKAADTKQGIVDFKKGSSTICIQGNAGQTLVGKEFQIYQLFHVENAAGGESVQYTIHEPFANPLKTVVGKRIGKPMNEVTEYAVIDYIQSLNQKQVEGAGATQPVEGASSEFRIFIEELRDEIRAQNIAGEKVNVVDVKEDNSIVITGLAYGYYIVDEISQVEGSHSAASMCIVNTLNPDGTVKIKSDYPTLVKKIQEDDNQEAIGNAGWNDLADYEIGQTVPFQLSSNVPNMNGYQTYYYAWHDRMDEALTFQKDSVSITIRSKELSKEYRLTKGEFQIQERPSNGDTFQITIPDLKSIVDREFPRMNEQKENRYGQEVILRYDAILNDLAAEQTGRPGFENDVCLEFSNNPDRDGAGSTGRTPWDTVVCFTYRLNGVKINNHDQVLEGAKFRLYEDEQCKKEVFVKQGKSGYIVIHRDRTGESRPTEAVEMVSNAKGLFIISGLDGGTYWLKETEAPAGYRPIEDPIRVEIIPTYTSERNTYVKGEGATEKTLQSFNVQVHIKQFFDGLLNQNDTALETDVEEGSGNLTVVNRVGNKLPITGSPYTIVLLVTGISCMIGALIRRRSE